MANGTTSSSSEESDIEANPKKSVWNSNITWGDNQQSDSPDQVPMLVL